MRVHFQFFLVLLLLACSGPATAETSYLNFESGPVRPLALSPDGTRLFVVNTPDNTLEIFDVGASGLTWATAVAVGLDPVAVAARTNDEVWVVNHVSDSVSVIDLAGAVPVVSRTLLVGDEPRDIVFAGADGRRAFISSARRGQHRTHDSIAGAFGEGESANPLLLALSDQADVWVFDAMDLGDTLGGTPVRVLSFFSDTPRALASDGQTVYVAAFQSGNQTTVVADEKVPDGFDNASPTFLAPGGLPGPDHNAFGTPAPETGLIVKWLPDVDSGEYAWRDIRGRNWNDTVIWRLPDNDVFAFDADTLEKKTIFRSVGTLLFNMVINPASGKIYVTTTESDNLNRFEGAGVHGGSTVQGRFSESRITILDPIENTLDVQPLNPHIDYDSLHTDPGADHTGINAQIPHSLALPLLPAVSNDGSRIYIPAFGSATLGVFTRDELEDPDFEAAYDPVEESADYIDTLGGGPSGVVLDETHNRLYVTTRFNNAVEEIDLATSDAHRIHPLHSPEPEPIVAGRPFLYDARLSGNGTVACALCHPFGDTDGLSWNLGDPDAPVSSNTQPSSTSQLEPDTTFHPMKGPMSTQTMRGLGQHGSLHWRGDRVDGFFGTDPCQEPGDALLHSTNAPCSENFAFLNFVSAFTELLGKRDPLSLEQMQQFANFGLNITMPPNPNRLLDNSLTTQQQAGRDEFFACGPDGDECGPNNPDGNVKFGSFSEDCKACHKHDPVNGFFGSDGRTSNALVEGDPQGFKVPQLRNLYTKVGMFKFSGDVVRGTGFLHDGSIATITEFLSLGFALSFPEKRALEQFLLVFPSDLAPIVGQQVTLGPDTFGVSDIHERIDLMQSRAATPFASLILGGNVNECDVIVKTVIAGVERGFVREPDGRYRPDDLGPSLSAPELRAKADPDAEGWILTYTAVPPGSGIRMGIDRDQDGLPNATETRTGVFNGPSDTGSDPALADSDGDGIDDGSEVAMGSNPVVVPEPSSLCPPVLLTLALLKRWNRSRKMA